MKQINMLESPVRQVFFSYLVPVHQRNTRDLHLYSGGHDDDGRGVGGSGIAAMNILLAALQHIFRDRNDVRSRRATSSLGFPEDAAMKNAPEVILRRHSVWCLLCQQSF